MESLGLSPSTPKPENRFKTLFWPAIRNEVDVHTIGRQGFWICLVIALFTLAVMALQNLVWMGVFEAAFFLLGGIGVRQRSRVAAIAVFSAYVLMTLAGMRVSHQGPGIVGILFMALLLSNVRGTWLSALWRPEVMEPPPMPLGETFTDKLTDRMPIHVWPFGKWVFYVVAAIQALLLISAEFAIR